MRWPRGVPDDLSHKRGLRGLRWSIAEGTAQWVPASLLENPEDFLHTNPPQRVLKESPVRTALIISGPQGELFFKQYKTRGLTERLKYFFVPSKARKEWVMAHRALSKGIATPHPLAMAERRKRWFLKDAFLVTQAISPSCPLIELIVEGRHEDLLARAARLIKGAHEAGLFHQDLHAGNILVGSAERQLYLIDLHRSRFVRSLSVQRRLWNLTQFLYSLRRWLSAEDNKAFLQRYDAEADIFKEGLEEGLRKVERLVERIYRRHMKSRTKRCLKDSGGFYVAKEDGWRIWARRGWKIEELLKVMKEHGDIVARGEDRLIKDDRRTAITLFPYKKTRICVKEYRYRGILQQLKEFFRRSKARRGWLMGNGLVVRGIAGITPQALVERRRQGLRREAFLIMETPPGYCELDRYMVQSFEDSHDSRLKKRAFLKALAGFMATLYELKIFHRDLKTCNIMVQEGRDNWNFGLVDMDDVQLDKAIQHKKLRKTLIQLNTSTPLYVDMKDRIRFLVHYVNLIKGNDVRDIVRGVITGSRGRALVYCSPGGDVIMDVDWEGSCALTSSAPFAKKDL